MVRFAQTSRVKVGEQIINAFGSSDAPGRDGVVRLVLHFLPTLGPEPRLVGWYSNMWTKNDLALSLDYFNLCPRLIQAKMTTNRGWNCNETTILDGDKGRRITHGASIAVIQSYCK